MKTGKIFLGKKKVIALFMMLILVLYPVGCAQNAVSQEYEKAKVEKQDGNKDSQEKSSQEKKEGFEKIKVVTTLFPQYDFSKQVGKEFVEVTLLLPPGAEAHSYEPTPKDILTIQNADLFIYTGESMEPWAHKVIENVGTDNIHVVDVSKGIEMIGSAHHHDHDHKDHDHDHKDHDHDHKDHDHDHEDHDHDHEDHDHDHKDHDHDHKDHDHDHKDHCHDHKDHCHAHNGVDPHVWLDPVYAQIMVNNIVDGLSKVSPNKAGIFKENGEVYNKGLQELDKEFVEVFKHTKHRTIMSGGHFAFGYFLKRYDLEFKSPYMGFAPDAEPTPKRIADLIDTIEETGITSIFYEELVDPKAARVISEEAGATMYLLHAAHNVSKEDYDAGVTYMDIMKQNMENLKKGLEYEKDE